MSFWFVYNTILIVNTVYDRSVWFVYNTILIVNTLYMIGLFDLPTIPF